MGIPVYYNMSVTFLFEDLVQLELLKPNSTSSRRYPDARLSSRLNYILSSNLVALAIFPYFIVETHVLLEKYSKLTK